MSSEIATSEFNTLIANAAAPTKVTVGGKRRATPQGEKRPYFRLTYSSLGQPSKIPGLCRGILFLECYAEDDIQAWALATKLTETLGCNGIVPVFPPNSSVNHFSLESSGWKKGNDPLNGGYVYCSLQFHYRN